MKILSATGGAIAASSLLPNKWSSPVVETGAIPVHAQSTPLLGTGDLQITLTWDTGVPLGDPGNRVDMDLHVIEPDGTEVYYVNRNGPTATLDFDNVYGFGPENIFVPVGNTATGNYQVFLHYFPGSDVFVPTTCTIVVRVFVGSAQEQTVTFTRVLSTSSERQLVAEIAFPSGTITELTGVPLQTAPLVVK